MHRDCAPQTMLSQHVQVTQGMRRESCAGAGLRWRWGALGQPSRRRRSAECSSRRRRRSSSRPTAAGAPGAGHEVFREFLRSNVYNPAARSETQEIPKFLREP
eukprot:gene11012-biopygen5599